MARGNTPSKKTVEYRESVKKIFDTTIELVDKKKDLEQLKPYQRVDVLLKLIQYFIPKPTEAQENTEKAKQDLAKILSTLTS